MLWKSVREYGHHWHVRNYKLVSDALIKAMPHKLHIRETKVWMFKRISEALKCAQLVSFKRIN